MNMIRCLFVDDNPSALAIYQHYLKTHPELEAVVITDDDELAMQAIRQQPIDLVFTDLEMPTYSGLDILSALEERGSGRAYLVTGSTIDKSSIASSALIDIITKPFSQSTFDQAIERFLANQ